MASADDYRSAVERCKRKAEQTLDEDSRSAWLRLAETYGFLVTIEAVVNPRATLKVDPASVPPESEFRREPMTNNERGSHLSGLAERAEGVEPSPPFMA